MVGRAQRPQSSHPRVADRVAERLRERILSGSVTGNVLPKQEDLVAEFRVSAQSVREALRILESEGLVRPIRGNVGGSVIRTPNSDTVAYTLAMVLQTRRVDLDDVADSVGDLEAICAARVAALADRSEIVARLRARLEEHRLLLDGEEFGRSSRSFHQDIVAGCGNQTLIIVLGAVEALWSAYAEHLTYGSVVDDCSADVRDRRLEIVRIHEEIIDAIERGDPAGARLLLEEHMREPAQYRLTGPGVIVQSSVVRGLTEEREDVADC